MLSRFRELFRLHQLFFFQRRDAFFVCANNDRWIVGTEKASIRARDVVIATNGYTDRLYSALSKSFVRLPVAMFATQAVPDQCLEIFLDNNSHYYDDDVLAPFQIARDSEGRLYSGGFAPCRLRCTPAQYAVLFQRQFKKRYPGVEPPAFRYAWTGYVCLTTDLTPKLYNPEPNLWAGMGYSGSGVMMATAMGREIALRIIGGGARWPLSDLHPYPVRSISQFVLAGVAPSMIRAFAAR